MLYALLLAVAMASPLSEELSAELMMLPSHDARITYIAERMGTSSGDETTRLSNALSVVTLLKQFDRNGAVEVMRFLEAAVADSPGLRAQAVARVALDGELPDNGPDRERRRTTAQASTTGRRWLLQSSPILSRRLRPALVRYDCTANNTCSGRI